MNSYLVSSYALGATLNSEKNNKGAEFTIKSKKTGKDFTFKIKRAEWNNAWYTHVYVETGYLQFKRLGCYFNGKIFNKHAVVDSPSAVAIGFVLDKVEKRQFEYLDRNTELMHLGKCLCCGRPLTDADSIQRGLGPICANHY